MKKNCFCSAVVVFVLFSVRLWEKSKHYCGGERG